MSRDVHSCTHWLRPRTPHLPPHWDWLGLVYVGAIGHIRHLYVTPWCAKTTNESRLWMSSHFLKLLKGAQAWEFLAPIFLHHQSTSGWATCELEKLNYIAIGACFPCIFGENRIHLMLRVSTHLKLRKRKTLLAPILNSLLFMFTYSKWQVSQTNFLILPLFEKVRLFRVYWVYAEQKISRQLGKKNIFLKFT